MSSQAAPRRRLPKIEFRVLIAGRANAGKTSILQRVCDTTKSPETYRIVDGKRTKIQLNPTSDRGEHEITDELVFSKHDGYVFHDSCGLENGSKKELETLQEFVREHAQKQRLRERLHVIWYCIPMDDRRPSLNIEPLHALRLDKNVPVIAVFTKCDAFRRNTRIDLEDDEEKAGGDLERLTDKECQEIFQRECLDKIEDTPFVCLEGMNEPSAHCEELIQATADALNSSAVTLMLLAVQTQNLELSVQFAVQKSLEVLHMKPAVLIGVRKSGLVGKLAGLGSHMTKFVKSGTKASTPGLSRSSQLEDVVRRCLQGFPGLWWFNLNLLDLLPNLNLDLDLLPLADDDDLAADDDDPNDDLPMALVQSLLSFAQQHQNHAGQDNNSHLFLLIALIIVLRYATITFINTKISHQAALNGAYQQYSAFNVPSKTAKWAAISTTWTTEDIVAFINSIPWDMNTAQ